MKRRNLLLTGGAVLLTQSSMSVLAQALEKNQDKNVKPAGGAATPAPIPPKVPNTTSKVVKARHVICVLGGWKSIDEVAPIVKAFGRGFEIDKEYFATKPDERMKKAFESSADRTNPSMQDSDWKAIAGHMSVMYILSPPVDREKSITIAVQTLGLISTLLKAGALAVKCESPGLAHGKAQWLALGERAKSARDDALIQVLIEATVRRPIEDGKILFSCGAHLLGVRDVETVGVMDQRQAVKLMDNLITAQIKAGFDAAIPSSIRVGAVTNPVPITSGPNMRHETDDYFYNPFGYLRVVQS